MSLDITKRLEQTQYSAALAITGAWRGTSRQKLYDELAQASNLDWLAKESPSKNSYQRCCENSFESIEKRVLVVKTVLSFRKN